MGFSSQNLALILSCFLIFYSLFFFVFTGHRAPYQPQINERLQRDCQFAQLEFFKSNVLMPLSLLHFDMKRKCLVTIVNSIGHLIANL